MTTPTPTPGLRDIGVSIIRTAVPTAWGAALTWVATQVPAFEDALNAPAAVGFGAILVAVLTTVWYSLMRKLEQFLPAWLTILVLGSNSQPRYDGPQAIPAPITGISRTTDYR